MDVFDIFKILCVSSVLAKWISLLVFNNILADPVWLARLFWIFTSRDYDGIRRFEIPDSIQLFLLHLLTKFGRQSDSSNWHILCLFFNYVTVTWSKAFNPILFVISGVAYFFGGRGGRQKSPTLVFSKLEMVWQWNLAFIEAVLCQLKISCEFSKWEIIFVTSA